MRSGSAANLPGAALALAAALGAVWPASGQRPSVDVSYLQVRGCEIQEAVSVDVDQDGRDDLVLMTISTKEGETIQRFLDVHLQREAEPHFAATPDRRIELVRDAVGFAVADVHPNPGREIVLFAPSLAAGLYWPEGSDEPSAFRLATIRLLWQPAHSYWCFDLQRTVVDFDADGFEDLLVPEPDGYRALLQRRGEDGAPGFETFELALPPLPVSDREEGTARFKAEGKNLALRFREDTRDRLSPLLEFEDLLPPPEVDDWDGDGDADVIALADQQLCVWQYADGFERQPGITHLLPRFEVSVLTPSNSLLVADLDKDQRMDLLYVTGRVRGDDIESYVEVFLQGDDGKPAERPSDRLKLQGFVDVPRMEDIDGDGRPELVIGSLRPDLIGTLSSGGSGTIDAQLNVFQNELESGEGRFARPVAMVHKIQLPADALRSRVRKRVITSFFHDVDGDGLQDFLERADGGKLALRLCTVDDGRYQLGDPVWEMNVDRNAVVTRRSSPDAAVLLIRERGQVIQVEIR